MLQPVSCVATETVFYIQQLLSRQKPGLFIRLFIEAGSHVDWAGFNITMSLGLALNSTLWGCWRVRGGGEGVGDGCHR